MPTTRNSRSVNLLSKATRACGVLSCAQLLFCLFPPADTDRDLLELERVWQYAKIYSLYQERVPDHADALGMSDPRELLDSLCDTLHNHVGDSAVTLSHYLRGTCRYTGNGGAGGDLTGVSEDTVVKFGRFYDSVGYLRIPEVVRSTPRQLRDADATLGEPPYLMLDLRESPGGNLDACSTTVSMFLGKGIPYLDVTHRKDGKGGDTGTVRVTWCSSGIENYLQGKRRIAVLVSQNTASASEILAAALRDALGPDTVCLIGDTTYGKAIGQYVFCFWFSSGSELHLTGFTFRRVGSAVRADYNEVGIEPDTVAQAPSRDPVAIAGEWLDSGFMDRYDSTLVGRLTSPGAAKTWPVGRAWGLCTKLVSPDVLPTFQ